MGPLGAFCATTLYATGGTLQHGSDLRLPIGAEPSPVSAARVQTLIAYSLWLLGVGLGKTRASPLPNGHRICPKAHKFLEYQVFVLTLVQHVVQE